MNPPAQLHWLENGIEQSVRWRSESGAPPPRRVVADRRGDVLLAQGKRAEAVAAYQIAWKALSPTLDYRRLVEAKLTSLAAPPQPASGAQP